VETGKKFWRAEEKKIKAVGQGGGKGKKRVGRKECRSV